MTVRAAHDGLILRAFRASDRDFFASLAGDERVVRYVGDGTRWRADRIEERVTLALQDTAPTQDGAVRWFIAECGQEPVGLFVANRRRSTVEIGYWVAPAHWGARARRSHAGCGSDPNGDDVRRRRRRGTHRSSQRTVGSRGAEAWFSPYWPGRCGPGRVRGRLTCASVCPDRTVTRGAGPTPRGAGRSAPRAALDLLAGGSSPFRHAVTSDAR